jgi:hypothetical protein
MDHAIVHNAADIPGDEKSILEGFLGQALRDNQQVFIMVFTPGVIPDVLTRQSLAARIERTLNEAAEGAAARRITADEADAAVDEAMNYIRHQRH